MSYRTVIIGTGSYIPPEIRKNSSFSSLSFYEAPGKPIGLPVEKIIEKFSKITGIEERRYAPDQINASGMALDAARKAIENSCTNPESLDLIIVAHNYGDLEPGSGQPDTVPSLAARVKHGLKIENPACVAFDILFGCPGWLQGLIQADIHFRAGAARRALIIGTETLSRIIDLTDRDSMIFSDGAGACVVEFRETGDKGEGMLSTGTRSDSLTELDYINFGPSYGAPEKTCGRFIKMQGRKVYEYALKYVPLAMKECFDRSGEAISSLKKIFIHQANEKMDEAILREFYALYDINELPPLIMPMSIAWLGNSSVATIPTLLDLVKRGDLPEHELEPGDIILFASVGAGMNINAVCYRC